MTEETSKPASVELVPNTPHPRSWQRLETAGDVRRFFRWLLLEVKRGRLDPKKANTLAFVGGHLLRAVELEDLEGRIARIEASQVAGESDPTIRIVVDGRDHETA